MYNGVWMKTNDGFAEYSNYSFIEQWEHGLDGFSFPGFYY